MNTNPKIDGEFHSEAHAIAVILMHENTRVSKENRTATIPAIGNSRVHRAANYLWAEHDYSISNS